MEYTNYTHVSLYTGRVVDVVVSSEDGFREHHQVKRERELPLDVACRILDENPYAISDGGELYRSFWCGKGNQSVSLEAVFAKVRR